jgi:hypothetical protein
MREPGLTRPAPDCLQRPLVPRSRFRQQVSFGVRHQLYRSGKEVRQQQWSCAQ